MRTLLIIFFLIVYYLFMGGLCCWYFHRYKIKEFKKEGWSAYVFFHGGRIRFAISGVLAIMTANLCLYGTTGW